MKGSREVTKIEPIEFRVSAGPRRDQGRADAGTYEIYRLAEPVTKRPSALVEFAARMLITVSGRIGIRQPFADPFVQFRRSEGVGQPHLGKAVESASVFIKWISTFSHKVLIAS